MHERPSVPQSLSPLAQLPQLGACANYIEWILDAKPGMVLRRSFVYRSGFASLIGDDREVACSEDQPPCKTVLDA